MSAPAEQPAVAAPAPKPLRLLGADAVVCEGDSCVVPSEENAQS